MKPEKKTTVLIKDRPSSSNGRRDTFNESIDHTIPKKRNLKDTDVTPINPIIDDD